ncbi:MAG: cytochrome c [Epsilonproteobacteria bacterium]|nr:cytochrome c [Campylobacterota bacterium]
MRFLLFCLLNATLLCAKSTFITQMEYASSLYKNPRGIGCQKCHGEVGEGRVVARYVHKKEQKVFEGPKINEIGYEKFYATLNKRNKGMPRYYLTDREIKALYFYLQEKKIEENSHAKPKS